MSAKYDVVIIGAGLGGLECGLILLKHGKKVCIVEKNPLIGGCLQTFRRQGTTFDTGFHYVGGLDEGQMLNKLFGYFGLMDLSWKKLDTDSFDDVFICNEKYSFANGYDKFTDTLSEKFPHQRKNLEDYVALLKKVGDNINHSFDPRSAETFFDTSLFAQSAYDFLTETISDKRLIDVLSGTSLKMELNAEKLPLYTFAQINSTFIQSAYRLQGGGMQIAETLRKQIEALGGTVLRNSPVTGVIEDNGLIKAVLTAQEQAIEADMFISNLHPAATMDILANSKLVRNIYRKRMSSLENTYGMLTVNIKLKPNKIKYRNKNIYAYTKEDLWHLDFSREAKPQAILISFQVPEANNQYVDNIDILTPMKWSEVERWNGTKVGNRGGEYDELKLSIANACIDEAANYIEGLHDAVDAFYTSTPLTYSDYTATKEGSAYGIRKNYKEPMYTILTPMTPVRNLLMTGQNLNLHGILGVSMTSIFTCAEILGMDTIANEIINQPQIIK